MQELKCQIPYNGEMTRSRSVLSLLVPLLVSLAACGTGITPTRSPGTSSSSSASAHASATAAPDTKSVTVTEIGIGRYDLVVVGVAVVANAAKYHDATGVVVHFTAKNRYGTVMHELDSPTVTIPAGATVPITVLCTDACVGASSIVAAVSVGAWQAHAASGTTVSLSNISCQGCSTPGSGSKSLAVTISGTHLTLGTIINEFAICRTGQGTINGGGLQQSVWTGAATTQQASIAVIATGYPADCTATAVLGS